MRIHVQMLHFYLSTMISSFDIFYSICFGGSTRIWGPRETQDLHRFYRHLNKKYMKSAAGTTTGIIQWDQWDEYNYHIPPCMVRQEMPNAAASARASKASTSSSFGCLWQVLTDPVISGNPITGHHDPQFLLPVSALRYCPYSGGML